MKQHLVIWAVALVLLTPALPIGSTSSPASSTTGAELTTTLEEIQSDPAPGPDRMLSFTERIQASVDTTATTLADDLVSPTAYLDPGSLDGIPEASQYDWIFRSYADLNAGGYAFNTGDAHLLWAYGAADAGSPVTDGDTKDIAVAHVPETPLYPPEPVDGTGEVSWETVETLRYEPGFSYKDANGQEAVSGGSITAFLAPTLRVDAGGLDTDEAIQIPEKTITVPALDMSFAVTGFPGSPPGTSLDVDVSYDDDDDGPVDIHLSGTIGADSQWPDSGYEDGRSTWTYTLLIGIPGSPVDEGDIPVSASQTSTGFGEEQVSNVLEIGPRGPGTLTELVIDDGPRQTIEPGPRAKVQAIGEDVSVDSLAWPGAGDTGGDDVGLQSTTAASQACGTDYATPGRGNTAPGKIGFNVSSTILEDVCMDGQRLGDVGLAYVEVDGEPVESEFVGPGPATTGTGSAAGVDYHVRAGPVEISADLYMWALPSGGQAFPYVWDFHATDSTEHTVRLVWLADGDPGPEEQLFLEGTVQMDEEGIAATDVISHQAHIMPHEIRASNGEAVQFLSWHNDEPVAFDRDGEGQPMDAPASELGHVLPPESLEDSDIAFLQPTVYMGTHMDWPHGMYNQNLLTFALRHG